MLVQRSELFKVLADPTRLSVLEAVERAGAPVGTDEIAGELRLSPSSARAHLERLRTAGLLEVGCARDGRVGRPRNRYRLSERGRYALSAPPPGPSPATGATEADVALLGELLHDALSRAGAPRVRGSAPDGPEPGEPREAPAGGGRLEWLLASPSCKRFAPQVREGEGGPVLVFSDCPFSAQARAQAGLVCALHRGLLEGALCAEGGVELSSFHGRSHEEPCRAELVVR